MKVAYIINQYPKVSHTFIRREILALEASGVEVDRISIRGWNEPVVDPVDVAEREKTSYVLKGGIGPLANAALNNLVRRPRRLFAALALTCRMTKGSQRSLFRHLIYLAEACLVALWLEKKGITHVHAHFGTNSTDVAMLAALLSDRTYSFTAHGSAEFDNPKGVGLAEKIRRAAFVVAVSSFGRSQMYRLVSFHHWPKIHVVHCGIDDEFFANAGYIEPAQAARLVCVGRLTEQKGQLLLLSALHRVMDSGKRCHLVLVGDGEMRAELESVIQRLNLQQAVTITGWRSSASVREEIIASHAFILPSFTEGLPVAIMEAMALHRPVISTFIGGIPELVDHACGWLVPAGDVEALARAIAECLEAPPDKLKMMGSIAFARVQDRHLVKSEASKLSDLFARTIAKGATT